MKAPKIGMNVHIPGSKRTKVPALKKLGAPEDAVNGRITAQPSKEQGKQQQWTVTFKHGDTECVATLGSSWLVKGHFSDAPFAVETADDEEPAGDSDLEEALEEELDAERNPDQACQICEKTDDADTMLLCEGCDGGYHCACLDPPLACTPAGDWLCATCAEPSSDVVALKGSAKVLKKGNVPFDVRWSKHQAVRVDARTQPKLQPSMIWTPSETGREPVDYFFKFFPRSIIADVVKNGEKLRMRHAKDKNKSRITEHEVAKVIGYLSR